MAETQANKLRARTRDALGPKVRRPRCRVCLSWADTGVSQSLSPLSAQGVTPGSEERYPLRPCCLSHLWPLHPLWNPE